jgi:hypothetical protein
VITTDFASDLTGVTMHDEVRAAPGWNLYSSMHGREAVLMDMDGRELHRWKGAPLPEGPQQPKLGLWWRSIRMLPNGDLLAMRDYGPLVKLDADSRPIWTYDAGCHHDFDIAPDGRIFAIVSGPQIRHPDFAYPLTEDFVVELGPDGKERRRVSLLDALAASEPREAIRELREHQRGEQGIARRDVTHLNALEILGPSPPGSHDAFEAGRLLLSTPKNHRVMLLDFAQQTIVWSLAGSFRYQHDPSFTEDGRVLLFDNRGGGERSRILALDPASGAELWSYGEPPAPPFFSECCGRVHALANGNLLVIISMEGRAIEITPGGELVWEFRSPHAVASKTAILNDVERIDPASLDPDFVARVAGSAR